MKLSKSSIEGAWLIDPVRYGDERGWFQEWFKKSEVQNQIGFSFEPVQLNISLSLQGVVRGRKCQYLTLCKCVVAGIACGV
jgi:dTDP-4-dehydrorhamnose 3,5-epimerase